MNMNVSIYEAILLDLGGVLVEFTGIEPLIRLSQGTLTIEEARRFWLESFWVKQFETGRCSPQEFVSGIITELKLFINTEEFLQEFISWEKGPFPGALELLDSLKPQFLLACFSNNNELHWQVLCNKSNIHLKFHHCYLSHEIGFMKPDKQAFEYVLSDIGVQPEKIVFFDDNQKCVDAASNLGLNAYRVQGVEEVAYILKTQHIDL
jgi:putative hydrolase of the HAD superfamily